MPKVSSAVISRHAWHRRSKIFFQFRTSVSSPLKVMLVIVRNLIDPLVAACCLQLGTLICPIRNYVWHLFLGQLHPNYQPNSVWSGSLMDLCRSSIYSLVSIKKPCTRDLESCDPSQLLSKIDILRFGPHVVDNVSETLLIFGCVRLITSTYCNGIRNVSLCGSDSFNRGS